MNRVIHRQALRVLLCGSSRLSHHALR
jgi:hypothetical protein